MAIAYENSASVASDGGVTTLTGSFTTSGSDRILFAGSWGANGSDSVSTMTYNGVSMTKVSGVVCPGDRGFSLWYLINPASGSNTLTASGSTLFQLTASCYSGVSQTGQPNASGTNTTTAGSSVTGTLSTPVDGCWMIMSGKDTWGGSTGGTGTTMRVTNNSLGMGDSNGSVGSAGSHSLIFNAGSPPGSIGVVFASFAPTAPPTSIKTIDGLAKASVKTVNGLAIASVKTWDGLA